MLCILRYVRPFLQELWQDVGARVNWIMTHEGDDCRFAGTSERFSSDTCAQFCRRELDQLGVTFELRQGEQDQFDSY